MALIAALTGTPGTGKTEVAEALEGRVEGLRVVPINDFAAEHGLVGDDGEVDVRDLEDHLRNDLAATGGMVGEDEAAATLLLEGHLGHHLSFLDVVVVLRCRPRVLIPRLRRRGWDDEKVRENAEAEALGVISAEAEGRAGWVYELETSDAEVDETAETVAAILAEPGAERFKSHEVGWVDHLDEVLDWY